MIHFDVTTEIARQHRSELARGVRNSRIRVRSRKAQSRRTSLTCD